MRCMDAIARRRSTRSFSSKPLDRETVERILAAGTMAPSAKNGFVALDITSHPTGVTLYAGR